MVGDGVNDAPHWRLQMSGSRSAQVLTWPLESAGIVLVRSDPRDVVGAIELSRATYRKMVQNLVWATAYNLVAIPVAGGLLPPGTRSAHERRCSRNERLHHHRGRLMLSCCDD